MSIKSRPLRIRMTFDSGAAAWIRAEAKFLYGSNRRAIEQLMLNAIRKDVACDNILRHLLPHLPDDIRKSFAFRNLG